MRAVVQSPSRESDSITMSNEQKLNSWLVLAFLVIAVVCLSSCRVIVNGQGRTGQ